MTTRSTEYAVRYAALARPERALVAGRGSIRYAIRRFANRARVHAASVRARSAHAALAAPGPLADGITITWIDHRDGGFFLVRAGWVLIACDVIPAQRAVLVFAIASKQELAARLGVSGVATRYRFVHTVFTSR
jgi:hypothetical protein